MKRLSLPVVVSFLLVSFFAAAQTDLMKNGEDAFKARNYTKAEAYFSTYIHSNQGQIDDYLRKKRAYDTSSAYVKGTTYANFKINHDWARAFYERAITYVRLAYNDNVEKDLEMALKIDPAYAEAYYREGLLKKDKGDKLGECICIGKAMSNSDTFKLARAAYSDNFCWETANEYFKKGREHVELKEYGAAIKELNTAIMISPDSGNYYAFRAMAFNGVGKTDSAIDDFANAIKVNPKSYFAYYYRALCYEQKQKYKDAFNDLTEAIKIRPNSAEAYMHRGDDCMAMEKEASAVYDYQQVIRIKPSEGIAYYKVAQYWLKLKQNPKACDYFNRALSLGIDDAQSYVDDCKKAAAAVLTK